MMELVSIRFHGVLLFLLGFSKISSSLVGGLLRFPEAFLSIVPKNRTYRGKVLQRNQMDIFHRAVS